MDLSGNPNFRGLSQIFIDDLQYVKETIHTVEQINFYEASLYKFEK
jgi:hypothetical protein